jgi:hypothetical protein
LRDRVGIVDLMTSTTAIAVVCHRGNGKRRRRAQ